MIEVPCPLCAPGVNVFRRSNVDKLQQDLFAHLLVGHDEEVAKANEYVADFLSKKLQQSFPPLKMAASHAWGCRLADKYAERYGEGKSSWVDEFITSAGLSRGEGDALYEELDRRHQTRDLSFFERKIILPLRFGFDYCEGKPFHGTYIADSQGNPEPILLCDDGEILRKAFFEERGLRLSDLPPLLSENFLWRREWMKEWLMNGREAKPTKQIYDGVLAYLRKYVFHPEKEVYHVLACYILSTHVWIGFDAFPRLLLLAKPESGKSQQVRAIRNLCFKPTASGDATKAALFRLANATAGVIIFDNFDQLPEEQKQGVMQFYEVSYQKDLPVYRAEDSGKGNKKVPTGYQTSTPVIAATIDRTPFSQAALTRSIVVVMERCPDGQNFPELPDDVPSDDSNALRRSLYEWGLSTVRRAREEGKTLEMSFVRRQAQIARPLMWVAREAGQEVEKEVSSWLKKNFESNYVEDEFSDFGLTVQALWGQTKLRTEPEIEVFVKDIAKGLCQALGVEEIDARGNRNPRYGVFLNKKCKEVSSHLATIPGGKKSRRDNGTIYKYQRPQLLRFFARFSLLSDEERQEKLTSPSSASLPTSPSSASLPTSPSSASLPTSPSSSPSSPSFSVYDVKDEGDEADVEKKDTHPLDLKDNFQTETSAIQEKTPITINLQTPLHAAIHNLKTEGRNVNDSFKELKKWEGFEWVSFSDFEDAWHERNNGKEVSP